MKCLSINARYVAAEAYNKAFETLEVELNFQETPSHYEQEFVVYPNQPNPFQSETLIGFYLPEAGEVILSIRDVNGSLIKQERHQLDKGQQQLSVRGEDLNASGLLYYTLEAGGEAVTRKMIFTR